MGLVCACLVYLLEILKKNKKNKNNNRNELELCVHLVSTESDK